ncbi:MAG: glycosyltransferase [Patescibacteria group bacterium]
MAYSKKLLIVSCSTGSGHGRAAEALRLSCQKLYPDVQALHIDFADYSSWIARVSIINSYNFFISRAPGLFGYIYKLSDNFAIQPFFKVAKFFLRQGVRKFLKKLKEYQPDHIISTHFLPQLVLPIEYPTPIDVVITDYHAHRIWLSPNTRKFFVASDQVKTELEKLGIKSIVSGLPVHPKFFRERDTQKLKEEFGINNGLPTILMMPAYRGELKAKEIVNTIFSYDKNVNVVAISGHNNERVFEELANIKKSGQKNLIVIKRAENIDDWMRVADIIVSKAGGLTVTEAMFLQKPIIIINPIPGQEVFNMEYLIKSGYGFGAESCDDLAKKIEKILANPGIIKKPAPSRSNEIILTEVLKKEE